MKIACFIISALLCIAWISAAIGCFAAIWTVWHDPTSAAWGFFLPGIFILLVGPIGIRAYWQMARDEP